MRVAIKKESYKLALLAVTFYVGLSLNYLIFISSKFAYSGYTNDFSAPRYLFSIVLVFVAFLLIQPSSSLRSILRTVVLGLVMVPALVYFSCGPGSWFYLVVVVMAIAVLFGASTFRLPALNFFAVSEGVFIKVLLACIGLYILSLVGFGGLSTFNLNLLEVYKYRDAAAESLPGLYGYISPVVGKILVPLYVVLSASQKKWNGVCLGVLMGLLIFGFTAHKSPFLYPFVALGVYWISQRSFNKLFLAGLLGLSVVSLAMFYIADLSGETSLVGSLVARRSLMTPAQLNFFHIEFFSSNTYAYWANSAVTFGLVDSNYALPTPKVIGLAYYNSPETAANTGWVGSGFANGGILGVVLYSVLIGVLVSYVAEQGKRIGNAVVASVSIVVFLTILLSADFFTSLLTHGVLFLVLLLSVIPGKARAVTSSNKKGKI